MDLLTTLVKLRPGKSVGLEPGSQTLQNVQWLDEKTYTEEHYAKLEDSVKSTLVFNPHVKVYTVSPFTIPTQEECQEYWDTQLKAELAMEALKKKRDALLAKSDIKSLPDFPHATEEVRQAWLDYRQALRDLPANTTDPENPVWPEAPTP